MTTKRQLTSLLLSSILVGQMGLAGWALAENGPEPSASPSPSVEATPSPSDQPDPSDSPSPTPSASPKPTASPSASPKPSASPRPKYSEPGPNGCGGVIPNWIYDTTSNTWVAADKGSFTCDKASGYYLSPKYYYDKQSGF